METRSLFVLAGLLAATMALADGAWKWTDENGVVHYSDVPVEGAEAVNITEYNRDTGANLSRNRAPSNSADDEPTTEVPFRYESITVSSPAAEETLWNIEGTLSVNVSLSPGLRSGHQVRAYFDGKAQMVQGTSFTLNEVYRGVHNLQVEIIDASGQLMIRSQPNRFYVQQNVLAR
ncbi:MAG: DUF4124 domain-containing protein [Woeseiaceae bacterium]